MPYLEIFWSSFQDILYHGICWHVEKWIKKIKEIIQKKKKLFSWYFDPSISLVMLIQSATLREVRIFSLWIKLRCPLNKDEVSVVKLLSKDLMVFSARNSSTYRRSTAIEFWKRWEGYRSFFFESFTKSATMHLLFGISFPPSLSHPIMTKSIRPFFDGTFTFFAAQLYTKQCEWLFKIT